METTPNLGLPLLETAQAQKELTVNEALGTLDALQAGILSHSIATPPGAPSDGDCYIIGPSPTGIWSGLANKLAYYLSGWRFIAPKAGMNLWVQDESGFVHYTGSGWVQSQSRAASRRNAILNGHFAIWQRGTSFAANGFAADRWLMDFGTGGAATVSRQSFTPGQTDVAGEPAFFLRYQQTTGGAAPSLSQKIEGLRLLAGRIVTLSLCVRAAAAITVTASLVENFGTGGSPSSAVAISGSSILVGTAWTRVSQTIALPGLGGKTFGTNNDDSLQLKLALPAGTVFTFDIAQVQIEIGDAATAFSAAALGEELLLCQRYYEPARAYLSGYAGAASATLAAPLAWKTEKRAMPAATNLATLIASANAASLAVDNLTTGGGRYVLTAAAAGQCTAGTLYGIDAEL